MPNYIQYSTSIPSGSLKKGNAALGITDSVAGPTSTNGWYTGINPPTGSYTVYEVAASGDPDIYCPINSTELINLVRSKGATGGNTGSVAAALAWIATQPNLLATNEVYPNIVTSGSLLNLDAQFVGSYPTTGSTWYDVSGNNNSGSLINGPTFNPVGAIVFDGVDDYVSCGNVLFNNVSAVTISIWVNIQTFIGNKSIISKGAQGEGSNTTFAAWIIVATTRIRNRFYNSTGTDGFVTTPNLSVNTWYNIIWTYNGSTIAVYTNGIAGETVSLSGPLKTNTNPIRIGQDIYGNNTAMTCASAQIYNRALTQAEILQNYYQAPIVTNGLVFAVDAGNIVSYESGSSLAYSLTGSISGSLTNGVGYSNTNGGVWNFDGVDDYINNIGDTSAFTFIQNTAIFTIDVWVKPNLLGTAMYFMGNNDGTTTSKGFYLGKQVNNGLWLALTRGVAGQLVLSFQPANFFTDTNWVNITVTCNGTTAIAYKNGTQFTTTTSISTLSTGNSQKSMSLGRINDLNSSYWNGDISITRIYNISLSQTEITQNFNAQKSRFGF